MAGVPAPPAKATGSATQPGQVENFATFQLKPFAVARESATHAWTAEDGLEGDAILKLAHNEHEAERLLNENERIKRRQLVYRKEPVWVVVQKAKAAGQPIQKLTLPAFDGEELEMEVTRSDLAPSGLSGTFAGRLSGREQSIATLAFKQGTEAFTIQSPEDGTYLQGNPREPGEIILTSFDPEKYLPLPGGEPIRTNDPLKKAE
jgi:hypothetical protein